MRKLVKLEGLSREEWLKIRQKGIGGSDIAAVCEKSSFGSPLSIYLSKTDQAIKDEEENIPAELGLELEPYLSKKFIKWIQKNEGLDIELKEMDSILQHDTIDYFLVNLDRWFTHPDRGDCAVELKTTTEFKREQWREDQVPDEYYLQCQWQLFITGWEFIYLAFLIGNRTFDVKIIPRNDVVIKNISDRATKFWIENVLNNQPPAPIGLMSDTEALKMLYPEEFPETEKLPTPGEEEEIIKNIELLTKFRIDNNDIKKKIDECQQKIKAIIGDNEFARAGNKLVTFKTVIVPEHVVKQFTFRRLFIKNLSK